MACLIRTAMAGPAWQLDERILPLGHRRTFSEKERLGHRRLRVAPTARTILGRRRMATPFSERYRCTPAFRLRPKGSSLIPLCHDSTVHLSRPLAPQILRRTACLHQVNLARSLRNLSSRHPLIFYPNPIPFQNPPNPSLQITMRRDSSV